MSRLAAFAKRAADRWKFGRNEDSTRFSEKGDTLIEVLLALVILGIASVALLTGFAVAITSSANHRQLTTLDSSIRAATDAAIAQVQAGEANAFGSCPNNYASTTFLQQAQPLGNSFTITAASVQYWSTTTSGFSTSNPCTTYGPQLWTLTVANSATGTYHYSAQTTTVIDDPSVPANNNPVGNPSKLVWLQTPNAGVVNSPVSPQPEIAVEDSSGDILTNNFSSVTLQVEPGGGTGTGTLSNSCSGVISYGVVPFGDCSLSSQGSYTLEAFDPNLTTNGNPTPFPAPSSFVVSPAPPAELVFSPAISGGTASSSATNALTVSEQDAFGNPTTAAMSVSLTSTSTGASFATTSGGTTSQTLTVTIPSGSSSATFYYGDTVAGNPMITASSNGIAPATQVETINAGAATKFSLSTPSPVAGTAFSESITATDAFGNVANSPTVPYTGAKCVAFAGPGTSPSPTKKAPAYPAANGCSSGSSVTFTNGLATASITLYDAQTTTLTATVGTITGSTGPFIVAERGPRNPYGGQSWRADRRDTVQRDAHRHGQLQQPRERNSERDLHRPERLAQRNRALLPVLRDVHHRSSPRTGHSV